MHPVSFNPIQTSGISEMTSHPMVLQSHVNRSPERSTSSFTPKPDGYYPQGFAGIGLKFEIGPMPDFLPVVRWELKGEASALFPIPIHDSQVKRNSLRQEHSGEMLLHPRIQRVCFDRSWYPIGPSARDRRQCAPCIDVMNCAPWMDLPRLHVQPGTNVYTVSR